MTNIGNFRNSDAALSFFPIVWYDKEKETNRLNLIKINELESEKISLLTEIKNKIVVGNDDSGKLRIIEMNSGKNVILGMFGYTCTSVLSCIGCDYTSSQNFASSILFKFFCLRHIIKNNPKFKKNWDKNYEKLPLEYKYIWKVVNLPDNVYSIIMGSCL